VTRRYASSITLTIRALRDLLPFILTKVHKSMLQTINYPVLVKAVYEREQQDLEDLAGRPSDTDQPR
jgi:hypothetical protein